MVRLLWVSVAVCAIALLVLAAALYHVNSRANARDEAFDSITRSSLITNCEEIERVKASLRQVFQRLVQFNIENGIPAADKRTELYADFIHDYFSPAPCPRREVIP